MKQMPHNRSNTINWICIYAKFKANRQVSAVNQMFIVNLSLCKPIPSEMQCKRNPRKSYSFAFTIQSILSILKMCYNKTVGAISAGIRTIAANWLLLVTIRLKTKERRNVFRSHISFANSTYEFQTKVFAQKRINTTSDTSEEKTSHVPKTTPHIHKKRRFEQTNNMNKNIYTFMLTRKFQAHFCFCLNKIKSNLLFRMPCILFQQLLCVRAANLSFSIHRT